MRLLPPSVLLFILAALPAARAVTLLSYNFTADDASVPTSTAANVSGSNLSWTGMTASRVGFSASTDTAYAYLDVVPSASDSGKYMEFTITAAAGYYLNLETLSFSLGGQSTAAGSEYVVYTTVRSSVGTYTTDLTLTSGGTTASHTVPGAFSSNFSGTAFVIDLSGIEFDEITSITFRFYPSDQVASPTNNNILRFKSISVQGEVLPIPEPNLTFLSLGGAGMLFILNQRGVRGWRRWI